MDIDDANWNSDPDWCAVAMSHAHRLHHIGIDSCGNYFCRECSRKGLYLLRDDEVARLLLMDRAKEPAAWRPHRRTDMAQPTNQPTVPDHTLPGDLPDRPDHPSIPERPDRPDHPDRPGRPDRPDQELPETPDPK